jgi:hypothetical protein
MSIQDKVRDTLEALEEYFVIFLIILFLVLFLFYDKIVYFCKKLKVMFFKAKRKTIHPKKDEMIIKYAKDLLKANNTITTLEVKNELRNKNPQYVWNQSDISAKLADLANKNILSFTDNGTYRVYSLIKKQKPNVMSTSRISRSKALEMIQESKGKFFTVKFISKKGEREMNCQFNAKTQQGKLGYLTVTDVVLREHRNINLQTLKELRINKKNYRIS